MKNDLRIFIADDEEDARFMLCRALEKAGLGRPEATFSDGEDFLQYWDDESPEGPSLLLLDLNMPRLTGFDVLLALQQRPTAERLRTIVVSGSNRDEDIAHAARLGAHGYLMKFPTPQVLAKVVNATVSVVSGSAGGEVSPRPLDRECGPRAGTVVTAPACSSAGSDGRRSRA